eukprot:gene8019-9528_t
MEAPLDLSKPSLKARGLSDTSYSSTISALELTESMKGTDKRRGSKDMESSLGNGSAYAPPAPFDQASASAPARVATSVTAFTVLGRQFQETSTSSGGATAPVRGSTASSENPLRCSSALPAGSEEEEQKEEEAAVAPQFDQLVSRRRGSAAGIVHQDGGTYSVHVWCLVRASEPQCKLSVSAAFMFLSAIIILFQILVMYLVMEESSHPRCIENEQCLEGEWCAPFLKSSEYTLDPGVCDDCFKAYRLYDGEDKDTERSKAAGLAWLESAVSYCNETDSMPYDCDHLVKSLRRVNVGTIFMLCTVSLLTYYPIIQDVEQALEEKSLLPVRLSQITSKLQRRVIRGFAMVVTWARLYFLPPSTVMATVSLLLSESLTARNILLNGLTVGFIFLMDDFIVLGFTPQALKQLGKSLAASKSRLDLFSKRTTGKRTIRMYVGVLCVSLTVFVLEMEDLILLFGNDTNSGTTACSDIVNVVFLSNLYFTLSAAVVLTAVTYCFTTHASSPWQVAFDGVFMPGLIWLISFQAKQATLSQ